MKLFTDLLNSFKNNDYGFSGGKLTWFTYIACTVAVVIIYCRALYLGLGWATSCVIAVISLLGGFALLYSGRATMQQFIAFKNGSTVKETETQVDTTITQKETITPAPAPAQANDGTANI